MDSLLRMLGVVSIRDPELARVALRLYREAYVREIAREAGLSQVVTDLALDGLRRRQESDAGSRGKEFQTPQV